MAGFEPATIRLTVEGSAVELHATGAQYPIRTDDIFITSEALYH